jgi:hypothetical protein
VTLPAENQQTVEALAGVVEEALRWVVIGVDRVPARAALRDLAAQAECAEVLRQWQRVSPVHRYECSPFSENGCTCGLDDVRARTSDALARLDGAR